MACGVSWGPATWMPVKSWRRCGYIRAHAYWLTSASLSEVELSTERDASQQVREVGHRGLSRIVDIDQPQRALLPGVGDITAEAHREPHHPPADEVDEGRCVRVDGGPETPHLPWG